MDPSSLITNDLVANVLLKEIGPEAELKLWLQNPGTKSGNNFFNVIKRIIVRYIVEDDEYVTSYIAKVNPCKTNDAFNPYRQRAMQKEIFFYQTLLPLLNTELRAMGEDDLRVPKYVDSVVEEGKEVIIFEDLAIKGFQVFHRMNVMDEAHTTIMAKELSRLHAASYALQSRYSEDLGTIFPFLIESWHCPEINLRDAFAKMFRKGFLFNLSLATAQGKYLDLIPWLQSISTRGMETMKKELNALPPWRCICHGDYHRSNVLFKYNESRNPVDIMVIDWQTVRMSSIAADISYLAYSSFMNPLRSEMLPCIADTYTAKYKQMLGPQAFFHRNQLLNEVDSNQFGILLCFCLIPLCECTGNPLDFFKIDNDEKLEKYDAKNEEAKAKKFLQDIPKLETIFTDFMEELKRKNVPNTH